MQGLFLVPMVTSENLCGKCCPKSQLSFIIPVRVEALTLGQIFNTMALLKLHLNEKFSSERQEKVLFPIVLRKVAFFCNKNP